MSTCPVCIHDAHNAGSCGSDQSCRCLFDWRNDTDTRDFFNLRNRVALMRELGVEEWDGIVLGPPPPAPKRDTTPAPRDASPEQTVREVKRARYRRELGREITDAMLDALP